MKLLFSVKPKNEFSVAKFAMAINSISCRIIIDFKNEIITTEDIQDEMAGKVIDLVNQHYNISSIGIDNFQPKVPKKPEKPQTVQSNVLDTKSNEVEKTTDSGIKSDRISSNELITQQKNICSNSKETALYNIVGTALENLDKTIPKEKNFIIFQKAIGLKLDEKLSEKILEEFESSGRKFRWKFLENISYNQKSNEELNEIIKKAFSDWLNKYPEIKDHRLFSFLHLLKLYSKCVN